MRYIFLWIFYACPVLLQAQTSVEDSGIFENLSGNEEVMQSNSDAAENLALLMKNPININKTDESGLLGAGYLKEVQINEIMAYINQYGPLINIHELQILPSINEETFFRIKSCFTVSGQTQDVNMLHHLAGREQSMLLLRYGTAPENVPVNWLGKGDKASIRFQTMIPNKMRLGLSLEKDAGEQIRWNAGKNQYGFDNINFYLHYLPSKKWKHLTIGTQRLQFGQGLLMGGGFYAGKGSETITTLRKNGRAIIPVGGTTEYGRLFGISSTYYITRHVSLTGFYSRTKEDAGIDTTADSYSFIQSISETGYHRTLSELAKRKTIQVQLAGYHVRYESKHFSAGNTFIYRYVSHAIQPKETYYNQFYTHGKVFSGTSFDFQGRFQNMLLFGEAALSATGAGALLVGAMIALHRKADLSVLYRNYSKAYINPYAQAFGESSVVSNEKGMYIGLKIRPKKEWSIHAYADTFVFPWLKYGIHTPSAGEEYFIKVEYKPSKKTMLYFQYRHEQKSWDASGTNLTLPAIRESAILYFEHKLSLSVTLRTRIQWGSYETNGAVTTGSLYAQDIIYKKRRYQLTFRWMWYEVEDYNARQYAYEPDVAYSFSIPAYAGKAVQPMLLIKYNLYKNIDWWFKITLTKPLASNAVESITSSVKSIYSGTWQVRFTF